MRRQAFLLSALLVQCLWTGCGSLPRSREVEQLQLIETLGYDMGPAGTVVSVSSGPQLSGEPPILLSARGESIADALERLRDFSPREELFFAHIRFAVMGEAAAAHGAGPLLDHFERGVQTSLELPLLVVRDGTAKELVTGSEDPEYEVTAALASLQRETEQRGAARFFTVREVAQRLARSGAALCCAVKAVSAEENAPSAGEGALAVTEAGYAVLKEGSLAGWLDPDAALGTDLLLDLAGQADYVLPGPGGAVTVELRNSRTRLTAAAEDGVLTVRAGTRARAGILEADGSGPLDDRALERLGKELSRAMAVQESRALSASRETGADFLELGTLLGTPLAGSREALLTGMRWRVTVLAEVDRSFDVDGTAPEAPDRG